MLLVATGKTADAFIHAEARLGTKYKQTLFFISRRCHEQGMVL